MSIEHFILNVVVQEWHTIHKSGAPPKSLSTIKLASKKSTNAAIVVMVLDNDTKRPVAIAKIPRNPQFSIVIDREYEAMLDIEKSLADPRVLAHVPHRGLLTKRNGVKILLIEGFWGYPMVREMANRKSVEELYGQIIPWMLDFHSVGAEEYELKGTLMKKLIEDPITCFFEQVKTFPENANGISESVRRYLTSLPARVQGRKVHLCRQHGDFNAHNILLQYERGHFITFKLIDLEDYRSDCLPIHDLNHFFTSNSNLLGSRLSPLDSYKKFVLGNSWYRRLYTEAISDFQRIIEPSLFMLLTPLYFVEMCLKISEDQRRQQNTANVWIGRLNAFIENSTLE